MQPGEVFTEVVSKQLPAGSYEFFAYADMEASSSSDSAGDARCELRQGNFFVGGTTSRIELTNSTQKRVLTVFGGAIIPTGGGEIGLWCMSQFTPDGRAGLVEEFVFDGLIMAVTLGGFN
jgi:hypothetical protein